MPRKISYSPFKSYPGTLITLLVLVYFFACTKSKPQQTVQNDAIVGKWKLTKSCRCDTCIDSSAFNYQVLEFSPDGHYQITAVVGDPIFQCKGTYTITHQSNGDILNIKMDSNCPADFFYIPGSHIYSETGTTLILDLNTPFANPCLYRNTYVATK